LEDRFPCATADLLGRFAISLVHGEEPGEDSLAVDECGAYERGDEVLVLSGKAQSLATST
jgi:hypothetical protein